MKFKSDYSSCFRILKGGKISLVVSTLLVSASLSTPANAEITMGTALTETYEYGAATLEETLEITTSGSITLVNGDSVGLLIDSDIPGTGWGQVINRGEISISRDQVLAGDLSGIKVTGEMSNPLYNYGSIEVTLTAQDDPDLSDTRGISVSGADSNGNVANYGMIIVDGTNDVYGVHAGIGIDVLNMDTTSEITAYKNGVLDASAYSVYTAGGIVSNFGTLNGNLNVTGRDEGGIEFGVINRDGATINLPYNAYQEDWAWASTFTNQAGATLTIGLQTDGTTITYSQLGATTATFEDGSKINVDVTAASTNVANIAGERLDDIIWTNNGLTVEGTIEIDDNSALLDFEIIRDEDSILDLSTIDLNIVEGTSIYDSTVAGGGNTPSKQNAQLLENFKNSNTGMDDFISTLNTCTTDECVASAVDELEVKLAGAGVSAAKQTAQSIAKIVRQRQGTFGLTGGNSGEEMFTEKNFWFKPFGTWGEQNDKDGLAGYDIKSYGFGIGADAINKDDQQLGFGLFYTNADVDVNGVNQNSDVDAFTILGYGSTPIINNKTKFLYQVGYSWQMTDTFRETLTGDAVADYTSNVASIDLKVMRDYQVNGKWLIQPTVGLSYTYFKAPSYSESGAGVASLDVNKFSTSETLLNIGAVSNYKIDDSSIFITTLDLGYDLENNDDAVTSTTQGGLQLADSESIDNGRVSYAIGLGYEKQLNNNSNLNFTYEYSGEGSDYSNNTISVKYVINF